MLIKEVKEDNTINYKIDKPKLGFMYPALTFIDKHKSLLKL
jgi:hypothetical protein